MKRLFTLVFAIGFLTTDAQLVENFSYTSTGVVVDDTLTNPSIGGGTWIRHSGTANQIKFITTGLTYTGYTGSGIGGAITMAHQSGSAQDVNRAVGPFTADAVYCSFMLNVTASGGTTGDYNFSFGATTGTNVTDLKARLFFKDGSVANTFKVGISKAGAAAATTFTTTDYPIGTPILVVIKYKFITGSGNDEASAYVFTSGVPATEPTTPTILAPDNTGTDLGAAGVVSICLRQGTVGVGACTMDGIRVANGWYNAPMPLSLKSFSASLVSGKANLNWSTSNEINVNGFAIERSKDGSNFNQVDFVAAKNSTTNSYAYTDAVTVANAAYYRLKMTDKDGSFKYSKIVTLNAKQSIQLEVFPNPVSNTVVASHTKAGESGVVKIITVDGKNVATQNIQVGATQSSIDVSKLKAGTYVIVFENDGARSSVQFVKQ